MVYSGQKNGGYWDYRTHWGAIEEMAHDATGDTESVHLSEAVQAETNEFGQSCHNPPIDHRSNKDTKWRNITNNLFFL